MSETRLKTALVVDDSKSARFALRKFLEAQGYQVDAVASADEAYTYLQHHRPGLIFLDHLMPGVNGFDVLQTLKKNPQTVAIPVIICSSNEGDGFVKQARTRGAADVLPKPPDADHLARVLERNKPLLAAAPSRPKVAPIREPEQAIEQALMRVVKSALTAESSPAPAPELAPLASPAEGAMSLREDIGQRLRKITQDVYRELGELKARLAHLDAPAKPVEVDQAQRLRTEMDEMLKRHERRIEEMIAASRRAAIEEAHQVAERAVLSASAKLSDQLTETVLKAIGRR